MHRDVIDAMMRQPSSDDTKPFKNTILVDSINIAAVDYDLGRNWHAYFDKDTADYHVSTGTKGEGNRGGKYRNDGVDISNDSTGRGGFYVSNFEEGEWLQYTFNTRKGGSRAVFIRLRTSGPTALSLRINGKQVSKRVPPYSSGSSTRWRKIDMGRHTLPNGQNKIRIYVTKGSVDLKDITIR